MRNIENFKKGAYRNLPLNGLFIDEMGTHSKEKIAVQIYDSEYNSTDYHVFEVVGSADPIIEFENEESRLDSLSDKNLCRETVELYYY